MNKKQFKNEMKSYIVTFAFELDRLAVRYESGSDEFIQSERDRAIGLAMSMAWAGIFTDEEFDDINNNMPMFFSHYKNGYTNFVEFYKRWGGEYLESFDRV